MIKQFPFPLINLWVYFIAKAHVLTGPGWGTLNLVSNTGRIWGLLVMDLRVVYGFNQNILISDTPWYSSLVQALFSSFMFTNDNTITKFWEEHFLITGSPLQMRQLALGSSENTFHPPASELPTKATVTMLLSHTQSACILKMPWEVKRPPSNTHSTLHGVLLCCYTRHQQQQTHVPNCGTKAKWLKNQKTRRA